MTLPEKGKWHDVPASEYEIKNNMINYIGGERYIRVIPTGAKGADNMPTVKIQYFREEVSLPLTLHSFYTRAARRLKAIEVSGYAVAAVIFGAWLIFMLAICWRELP